MISTCNRLNYTTLSFRRRVSPTVSGITRTNWRTPASSWLSSISSVSSPLSCTLSSLSLLVPFVLNTFHGIFFVDDASFDSEMTNTIYILERGRGFPILNSCLNLRRSARPPASLRWSFFPTVIWNPTSSDSCAWGHKTALWGQRKSQLSQE